MKKKSQKKTIDTTSIHEGLIDNYNVDDKNIKMDDRSNVQDFQSVTESIEKPVSYTHLTLPTSDLV